MPKRQHRGLALLTWAVGLGAAGCTHDDPAMTGSDGSVPQPAAARDVPVSAAPTTFGPGFTDLTNALDGTPLAFLPSPRMNPGEDPEPTVGIVADLDGDGTTEVLMGPTLPSPSNKTVAYRHDATRGLAPGEPIGIPSAVDRLSVVASLDLDGDGNVDLLTNHPEREVAWGLGGGRFDAPSSLTTTTTGQFMQNYAALLVDDLDADGWLDAVFGSSECCTTCRGLKVYLRTGPRTFADRTELFDDAPPGYSYAVLSGTLNGTPLLMNIGGGCGGQDAPSFFRRRTTDPAGYPRFEPFDPIPRDAFIRTSEGDARRNASRPLSFWVPMGAAVGDADGDGRIDVAISLNFFAGLFRDVGVFPMADHTAQFGGRPVVARMSGRRMIPWGIALVDVDQDERPDLFTVHGDDHSSATDPNYFIGPQHPTVHWNAGGTAYTDVTSRLGVDRQGQWRSLGVDDLDRDGDADFIVGSQAAYPRVFRNDIATGNHGFSLRLRGTTSNALGVGALVSVQVAEGGPEQVHVMGSVGSPLVFSTPTIFAGLGRATRAARVRVTWPSGQVQEVRDLAAGTMHTIEEPAFIALTSASRHVPADGRGTVTVRVTPRLPDGAVRADARVEVALAYGGGTITPARWTGAAWEATVTAPATRGSSAVAVSIDGVAAGVRPRLWWD